MYVCMFTYSCSKDETKTAAQSSSEETFYKPSGVITQDKAKGLNDAWTAKNTSKFSKGASMKFENDDRSFWWTIEDIRNYLDYSENIAKENGHVLNGLRVYLGAYPNTGKTTLFMVPTIKNSTSKASMSPFVFQDEGKDCPECPPLNDGAGGGGTGGGYPQ